jgi:hypothetical protein
VFDLLERLAHLYHPRPSNQHRPRVLHPEAFAFYIMILVGLAGVLPWLPRLSPHLGGVLGFSSAITPEQVIDQTNQVRRSQGLPALKYNATLAAAAARKGQDMLANHYWAHVSPTGKTPWAFMAEAGYRYRVAGENLARDFSNTPDMIQAWLNSPTHRANVLSDRYEEIGVAVLPGKLDTYETTLVVQMFGSPKTAPAALLQAGAQVAEPDTAKPAETVEPVIGVASQPGEGSVIPGQPAVLASAVLPAGHLLQLGPVLSPRVLLMAVSFAFVLMLVATLLYDWLWVSRRTDGLERVVGQNWAHLLYLAVIALLMALYKGGAVS